MATQLDLFGERPPLLIPFQVAHSDNGGGYSYAQALLAMLDDPFVIRRRKLDGSLIASKYAHLSLDEAALLFIGDDAKPAQASAWVLALLMAQVRPPQREAIDSNPKLRLKRKAGRAREPPPCGLCRLGSASLIS
ncbi:hypothetical protein [Massilia sp. KIM]|uniref:hypothetical protein n=1 Tax=Massilia sp. KIM TaxID=1955422 RepID=UPI001180D13E|nr:hypothetical protein [Massilia sp. KIM]